MNNDSYVWAENNRSTDPSSSENSTLRTLAVTGLVIVGVATLSGVIAITATNFVANRDFRAITHNG